MAPVSLVFGLVLIGLGVGGYVATGSEHVTALIPAFFGGVLFLLGLLAFKTTMRRHAMHGAAMIGLLGCIVPGYMGFPKLFTHLSGDLVERPTAAVEQALMSVICACFLVLCVRSFIAARKARKQQASTA